MSTAVNMYALTWNAALAVQSGLPAALEPFVQGDAISESFDRDVMDGFHLAHSGQLAFLTTGFYHYHLPRATASHDTIIDLARGGLTAEIEFNRRDEHAQDRGLAAAMARIHKARMSVDESWFRDHAKNSPRLNPMPSSVNQSMMIYWSILVENGRALREDVENEADGIVRSPHFTGPIRQGLQMALASLVTMFPYYSAASTASDLAPDIFRLKEGMAGQDEAGDIVLRIVDRLEKVSRNTMYGSIHDLRGFSGMWGLMRRGDLNNEQERSMFTDLLTRRI